MVKIDTKVGVAGVLCLLLLGGCSSSEIPSFDASTMKNTIPTIPAVAPGSSLPPATVSDETGIKIGSGLVSVETPAASPPVYGPTVPSPTASPTASNKPRISINKVSEIALGSNGTFFLATDAGLWEATKVPGSDTDFTATRVGENVWNATSFAHDMSSHIYYSSGYADDSKDATPLGLVASGDSGRSWEILSLGKQIAFGALSSGLSKENFTFIIGVDLKTGVLVLSKNAGKGDWFQGPDGSYSSVAVSGNRMLALDIKDGKLWYSDYTGEGWSYIAWPKYMFMFPASGNSGKLFFVEPEKNELYVLDKFDVKKGDELYKTVSLVGELPSKGTVESGIASGEMLMLLVDQELFVSYDGGKTYKQATVTLK